MRGRGLVADTWAGVTFRRVAWSVLAALMLLVSPGVASAMQQHLGYLTSSATGKPAGGATVTVYKSDAVTLATLYYDNGVTPKPNPFTTDVSDGSYRFYALNGRYKVVFAKAGLVFDDTDTADILLYDPTVTQTINIADYGAVGDGTDVAGANTAALQAAIDAAKVDVLAGDTNTERMVLWPPGLYSVCSLDFIDSDRVTHLALGSVRIVGNCTAEAVINLAGGQTSPTPETNRFRMAGAFAVEPGTGTYNYGAKVTHLVRSHIELAGSGSFGVAGVGVGFSWLNTFLIRPMSNDNPTGHIVKMIDGVVNTNLFNVHLTGRLSTNPTSTQTGMSIKGFSNTITGSIQAIYNGLDITGAKGTVVSGLYQEATKFCYVTGIGSGAAQGTTITGGYCNVLTDGVAFTLGAGGGSQATTISGMYIDGQDTGSNRTAFALGTLTFGLNTHSNALVDIDTEYTGTLNGVGGGLMEFNVHQTRALIFPSTEVPSTNTNTLTHYKKSGTWTPALTAATPGDLVATLSTADGHYMKIGSLIVATFTVITSTWTHTTAAGDLRITGLDPDLIPVTVANINPIGSVVVSGVSKAGYSHYNSYLEPGTSNLKLYASGDTVARATMAVTDFPSAGSVILRGTIIYQGQ